MITEQLTKQMPTTYSFTGDATTILGFIGIVSAAIIIITAFRRYFNSPYIK